MEFTHRALLAPALLASSLLLMGAAPPRAQRIAVYDLKSSGVSPELARILTDAVVEEARKLEGIAVVGMSEIRAMLNHEAEKQLVGCDDESCVSEIAEALGVDGLLIGSISIVGTDQIFMLKRIDQREAETVGSFTARALVGDDETLLASIGPAIEKVFPERALRPNASRGVSTRLHKRLKPPPLPPVVLYSGLATTTLAVVAAAAVTVPTVVSLAAFDAYKSDPAHRAAYDLREHERLGADAQTWAIGAAVAWSIAGVCALATAGIFFLTDFDRDAAVGGDAP